MSSNREQWQGLLAELDQRQAQAEAMGGEEKIARQHARGRLTARQRLALLFDPGTLNEIGALAGANHPGGQVPLAGDGVVGFSLATPETREVDALFVLPGHSGYGIGHDLLTAAVRHLRSLASGPVRLRTDPDEPAYAFYVRRGWRDKGECPKENGLDGDRILELE